MKHLTEQQVKEYLGKEGYQLLSPYINSAVKITTICPRGHQYECVFTSFRQGHRCGICVGHNRWNLEKIREELKRDGYTLLAKEYKEVHGRLAVQCPKGHFCTITWAGFQSGNKCKTCGVEKRAQGRRVDIEEIRRVVEKEGYQLLSTEYGGPNKKLEAICPRGHKYHFQWYRFTKGVRCGECYYWNFEKVKKFVEVNGFILLSKEYKGSHEDLKIQCPQGHQYRVLWTNFQQGYRCPDCMHDNKRLTIGEVRQELEKEGYKLLSTQYTNNKSILVYECPKGHKNKMKWYLFQVGHRCPDCYEWRGQKILGELLKQIYPGGVLHHVHPDFLKGLELDFSIHGQRLAFEYDGQQHYFPVRFGGMTQQQAQKNFKQQKKRDKSKDKLCKKNGYRLIRVKYDEPLTLENVKDRIKNG